MPITPHFRSRAWIVALIACAAALALHVVLPVGSLEQNLLYDGIATAAVVGILVGIRLHRPEYVMPWLLIAAGQASFVVGDLLWVWFELHGETPFPSVADVFYLGGYPFIALAFGLLIQRRIGGGDRAGLLDAAILTTGAAILSWVLLIEPSFAGTEATPLELLISLAYPLADLLVIGVATGLLTTPGARTPSFGLLVGGLLVLLVSDETYALQNLHGTYESGSLLDLGWLVAYLVTALAALHPSMREVVRPQPVNVTWLGPVRLAFLAAAMLTGPVVMTIAGEVDGIVGWVVAGASGILSMLVLARLAGLVRMLAHDVAARSALEAQLSHQANHDPLTGLANRRRFVEQVGEALAGGGRWRGAGSRGHVLPQETGNAALAVLFLDLDDFKAVNDTLGHAAGDQLLVAIAGRIGECLRDGDLAARLGGDEFGVLLGRVREPALAEAIASRILAAIHEPVAVEAGTASVGGSVGIAWVDPSKGASSVDDLLHDADVAMYQAKADGKGRSRTFASSMHAAVSERVRLRNELARAVAHREFVIHLQPIVRLDNRAVRGLEALVRWNHPSRGLLPPSEFVPLAEETGLIVEIGAQVLDAACREVVRLDGRHESNSPSTIAVNVSPQQLASPAFAELVTRTLRTTGLRAGRLVLEITESVLVHDDGAGVANLRRLRELGVRVAIDDFGTGYSSLASLHRYPLDILKIDRSFLDLGAPAAEDWALVRLVVGIGRTLGLETIAEGVEHEEQARELVRLGCVAAQGFLFSEPVEPAALDELLAGGGSAGAARATRVGDVGHGSARLGLEGA